MKAGMQSHLAFRFDPISPKKDFIFWGMRKPTARGEIVALLARKFATELF